MLSVKIIDTHCDALFKLQLAKRGKYYHAEQLDYRNADQIDTNLERLKKGKVMIQFFAIFIYPDVPSDEKWQHALEQIDLFYTEILGNNSTMKQIKKWS